MSLDGFVTGPHLNQYPGLGEGGDVLQAWVAADRAVLCLPRRCQTCEVVRCSSIAGSTRSAVAATQTASSYPVLLQHLRVAQADVFGFSVGGGVALHLAIRHPEPVRKLIVSSVSFHPDGDHSENSDAVRAMTVDMIAGTRRSRNPGPNPRIRTGYRTCSTSSATSTRASPADPTPTSTESSRRPSSPSATVTPST
jgi:pimeloyl-ACP methyl ester carboxylesterase